MGAYAFKIDIDPQLDQQLKDIENKFVSIAEKSESTQKRVDESFKSLATGGIDNFLTKLQDVQTKLSTLKVGQGNSITSIGTAAQTSADKVDKLLDVIAGMAKALTVKKGGSRKTITEELKELKPTGIDNVKAALDNMINSLAKARADIKLYNEAIGTGKKSYVSFGQEGLKEANAKAEQLMRTISALHQVYDSLRGGNDFFKSYINDISGASEATARHKKELDDLKRAIQDKHTAEMQSKYSEDKDINIEKAQKNIERVKRESKERQKAVDDANKLYSSLFDQIDKRNAQSFAGIMKVSNALISSMTKAVEAENNRDSVMVANSDKAMNHVLENIRKEEEARRKTIEAQKPQNGSQFSALSSVTEWKGLNKQIQEASHRIETIKKIMSDFSGKEGKENVLKYYTKEISLLEASIAKWRSKQQVIVDANHAIAAQEKFKQQMLNNAQGGLDFEKQKSQARLEAMRQYYQEQERLSKIAYENRIKESKELNAKNLKTYEGAMKFSDTAKTENRHKKAIEFLLEARKKLTTADAEYASKLDDLNGRIARHKLFLKQAAMTTEELAKSRQKYKRELEDKFYSSNSSNALTFSQNAKSINEQIRAIKYLTAARDNLNKHDKNYEHTLRQLNNEISRNKRELDLATEGANRLRGSHNNLMDTADQLKRSLALMFSVSAMTNYINKLVSVRGEFELQQRSLEAILQNKDEADILWNKTVQLAVKSPFRVGELVSYTKQLAAYRIESDKLYETNKMLADISAGLGVDMGRLILAYGQVKAANYLRGTELRQFSEAGVNILGELSKYFTELEGHAVSVGDVFERVSKRMVSFEDVTHVLKNLTSESGIFYEMQEKQAETLKGMVSNLRDSIDLMLNEIGKSSEGTLKSVLSLVKSLIDNWELATTILKALVLGLAAYKMNLLLSSDASFKLAIQTKVVTGMLPRQLTLVQLLTAAWRKFTISIKSAAKGIKGFIVSNAWLVALTAVITTMHELSTMNDELNAKMKDINNTRDDEIVKVEKLVSAYKRLEKARTKDGKYDEDKNIENKKAQLLELQKYAKDSGIEVDVKLEGAKESELDKQFKDIQDKLDFSINFSAEFDTSFASKLTSIEGWFHIFGDNLQTDMEEFNSSFGQLGGQTREVVKKSMTEIGAMYDKLSDEAKGYYDTIKDGKKETETNDEYLLRQIEQLQKINNLYTKVDKGLNGSIVTYYDLRNGKDLFNVERKRLNIARKRIEFEKELSKVADDIKKKYGDISKLDDWQKKTIQLKIDKAFERMELNESAKRVAVFFMNKKFGLPIDLTIKPEDVNLEQWQKDVLESITNLNSQLKGKYQIRFSVENVKGKTKEQVQNYIKGLVETAEKAVEIFEKLKGEQKIVSETDYTQFKTQLPILIKMSHVVGNLDKNAKKHEEEQVKILNNRIKLIQDIHKEYKSLEKTMGDTYAKERVMSSYAETFKQAFEGTGVTFKSSFIDESKIAYLKKEGEEAGEAISVAMIHKIEELQKKGTYIRSMSDELVDFTKKFEGFRSKAYNLGDGKWTIGYGETQGVKKGDKITEEEARLKMLTRMQNDFVKGLNNVLDANNELILTQEQYNALLDLTYQGGPMAASRIIDYAKDIDKGVEHITDLYNKIKASRGTDAAERFGESFLKAFKDAETIQERMALLMQTMNLTINGGKISDRLYSGMQKRSDARAAMFSGDIKLAKVLQKVVTDIAEIDFTNLQGVYDSLKQLEPIAKKEGEKAYLELQKVLSHVKSQIEVEAKLENDKKIQDEIDGLFGDYEMYVALDNMDFPPDLANQIFNVGAISLDELKNKIIELKPKFEGKDMIDEWNKVMKKIDDIEARKQEERIKEYIKYIREEQDERVKLKIEEMKKLQEIEESKDFTPTLKFNLKQNVKAEYKKKDQKQAWEDFKNSDIYTMMFNDLENLGTQALNIIYDNLQRLKSSLTDLPVQDVKEIMNIINNIEDAKATRNPFKELKHSMEEVRMLKSEGRDEDFLQREIAVSQMKIDSAQDELNVVNTIINARQQGITITQEMMQGQEKYNKLLGLEDIFLQGKKSALEGIIQANKDNMSNASKDLQSYVKARKNAQKLEDEWKSIFSMASKGYDAIKSILVAMGVDADSTAMALADMGMSMVDLIGQAIMFGLQLQALSYAATILGVELNAALGPIGWAVLALQGIATIFTSIFAIGDKKKEKQIKREQEVVENLERSYEKLEQAMNDAFSIGSLKNTSRLTKQNIEMQIASLNRMIQLEDDKKKTDHDKIKDWKHQIEDLRDKLKELQEDEIKAVGGFGSQDAFKSAAEEFADAWYEAFKETGVGLTGLEDTFDDFIDKIVKKQLLFRGTEAILKPLLQMIDNAVADAVLSKEELDDINKEFNGKTKEQLDALYHSLVDSLGIKPNGKGELSGLQEGIQGVTEETAQIIESYLNSIRFFVADTNTQLKDFVSSIISESGDNPIVEQLKVVAANTTAIRSLLESITAPHPTLSGRGLKVVI